MSQPSPTALLVWSNRQIALRATALSSLIRVEKLKNSSQLLDSLNILSTSSLLAQCDIKELTQLTSTVSQETLSIASSQEGNASFNSKCSRALSVAVHTSSILQLLANASMGSGSAVVSSIDLNALIFNAISDTKANIRSKIGACPNFSFTGTATATTPSSSLICCCVPSWWSFSLIEILKNAAISHLQKYGGAAGVEDGPSINIHVHVDESFVNISIIDYGIGLEVQKKDIPVCDKGEGWSWGDSRHIRRSQGEADEPNYGYSRDFGPPVSSHGIGLARISVCINSLHGGHFSLKNNTTDFKSGVQATITIPRNGTLIIDPLPQLLTYL